MLSSILSLTIFLTFQFAYALPSSRATLSQHCGTDARIISTHNIEYNGRTIVATVSSCSAAQESTDNFSGVLNPKRQNVHDLCDSVSGDSCLASRTQCSSIDVVQPFIQDCIDMDNALLAEATTTNFLVGPNDVIILTTGTCQYLFGNLDTVAYNVCAGALANWGSEIGAICSSSNIGAPTSGICFSTVLPGQHVWEMVRALTGSINV